MIVHPQPGTYAKHPGTFVWVDSGQAMPDKVPSRLMIHAGFMSVTEGGGTNGGGHSAFVSLPRHASDPDAALALLDAFAESMGIPATTKGA